MFEFSVLLLLAMLLAVAVAGLVILLKRPDGQKAGPPRKPPSADSGPKAPPLPYVQPTTPPLPPPPPVQPPSSTGKEGGSSGSGGSVGGQGGGTGWGQPVDEPVTEKQLDVKRKFPDRSSTTNAWTQEFVDAALAYPGVTAERHDDGIAFDPNFVWIERVYTTRFDGFSASFFGRPRQFREKGIPVENGRATTWSRIKVKRREDLDQALKALRIAYKLKERR